MRILCLKEIEAIDSLTFSCFTKRFSLSEDKTEKAKMIIASSRWPEAVAGSAGVSRIHGKPVFGTYKAKSSSVRPNR